ncbi:MAG: hypothetical protein LC130_24965 [Bryobacterales bacterium]|nr:hypothetical protein [Bryobacterales bacterium]
MITMLEELGFQSLVEQTVISKRIPRAMDLYRFVLGIVLGLYIGFARLNQLPFIARDPALTGILKVVKLPVQSTFWRFVNALHRHVARQILTLMRTMPSGKQIRDHLRNVRTALPPGVKRIYAGPIRVSMP